MSKKAYTIKAQLDSRTPCIWSSQSIEKVMAWAQIYLDKMKKEHEKSKKTLAVTFDIDDTILRSSDAVHSKLIQDTHAVYELALQLKFKVFFITARPNEMVGNKSNYDMTVEELRSYGFPHFDGLFLMPTENLKTDDNWSKFKRSIREKLWDNGVDIVLNVGDQWSDLMLLPPYSLKTIVDPILKSASNKKMYYILLPPDISWMAIKMPHR